MSNARAVKEKQARGRKELNGVAGRQHWSAEGGGSTPQEAV